MPACVLYFVERLQKTPEGAGDTDHQIVVDGEMRFFAEEAEGSFLYWRIVCTQFHVPRKLALKSPGPRNP